MSELWSTLTDLNQHLEKNETNIQIILFGTFLERIIKNIKHTKKVVVFSEMFQWCVDVRKVCVL